MIRLATTLVAPMLLAMTRLAYPGATIDDFVQKLLHDGKLSLRSVVSRAASHQQANRPSN
jgi:hypothetical protein